jgi:hypothetical protein
MVNTVYIPDPGYEEVTMAEYERKTRTWELKFCWLPHRCMETMKVLWLKKAYCGYKTRRYDMDFVHSDKWMCKEEFVVLRLMDKI